MKANPLITLAAVLLAVILLCVFVMFARQAGLEKEIGGLRTALEATRTAQAVTAQRAENAQVLAADAGTVGTPGQATSDETLAAARARIDELERVLHGQADVLEGLVAQEQRRQEELRKAAMRAWGPEQASGAPDTLTAGDQRTAWAPAVADGGVEWLEAEFENAADLAKIVVRQTCNPGGITKVVAIGAGGREIPVWAGVDPSKGQQLADTPFAVPGGINANRVRVYIDTSKVAGWEEIDAVQIVGRDGASQWAKSTNASSTYAAGRSGARLTEDVSNHIQFFLDGR